MKFAVRGLTLVSVLAFLFMIFSFVRKENVIVVNDFTFILVSFCASLALFLTYRRVKFKDEKQVWFLLAAGSFVSFLAEIVWGYNEVIARVLTPSPGPVDVLWIVGEAIILLAVFKQLQNSFFSSNANWCSTLAWVLGSVLLGLTISIFFILHDFSAVVGVSLIHVFIASLILICAICLVWPLLRINSRLVLPWLFLCLAYFMFATEATLFAYESVSSVFQTGTFVDFIYVLGYIFLCLAAWAKSSVLRGESK